MDGHKTLLKVCAGHEMDEHKHCQKCLQVMRWKDTNIVKSAHVMRWKDTNTVKSVCRS